MTEKYMFSVCHNLKENNLLSPLTSRLLLLPRASKPEFVFISRCCFPQHFALLAIQTAIKVQPASEFVRQCSERHTFSTSILQEVLFTCFSYLERSWNLDCTCQLEATERERKKNFIITERIFYLGYH